MTYDALAGSDRAGLPVFLYTFIRGSKFWRYSNIDGGYEADGQIFKGEAIFHSDIEVGPELSKSTVKVTVPRTNPVADLYRVAPPREEIACIIQAIEHNDPDRQIAAIWSGRITSPNWTNKGTCELAIEPAQVSLRRNGLRQTQQKTCPYVLYGPGCDLSRESFRQNIAIQNNGGFVLTAPEFADKPDGKWAGGFIEWAPETGIVDRRFIVDHRGSEITVDAFVLDLKPGDVVAAYPGCDHTTKTCDEDFGNLLNYGGLPAFATINPFAGTTLY